jgi:hypothetical protein
LFRRLLAGYQNPISAFEILAVTIAAARPICDCVADGAALPR